MKRSKVKRGTAIPSTPYQGFLLDKEAKAGDENSKEVLSFRALQNLRMALFFSWLQGQMNNDQPNG
ncbi:hypothetical protein [Parapedobacter sp. DT-150]|uniref:hypothetical protein n=1 Tax=Parapedobacter sp. DT-150 TaxID=3396162 RepID=UPI003F1B701A